MPKVLVSDKLSPTAVQIFKDNGVEVDYLPDLGKLILSCPFLSDDLRREIVLYRAKSDGIPPTLLPHLGEPIMLCSGASEKSRSVHGAGLGLAICRRIVAYHGGRMLVETCPGKGTTVMVWLRRDLSEPVLGTGHCPLDREVCG